jgi:hypothetical protein
MAGPAAPEAVSTRTVKDMAVAALAVVGLATVLLAVPVPPALTMVEVAVVAALEGSAGMLPAPQAVLEARRQQPLVPLLHL